MVGTSILLGRALSPVEQLAAHWGALHVALSGWRRLDGFLRASGASPLQTPHRLRGPLVVQGLGVLRPGRPVPLLRLAGFEVAPGRALGVIGPSGSGKSLLARVLAGATAQSSGTLRFAGVALWRVPPERIGYLPQRFGLLPGTIGEAIARHDGEASPARIEAAAVLAGVHDAIRRLPEGYATPVTEEVATLPAGVVQLIGLARALYDEPSLIILDEPTAHLDGAGLAQLNAAIHAAKARGAVVVVTAHRPGAIAECDDLLVLEDGVQTGFGPRETVLRGLMRPARAPVADPAAESAPTAGASAGPAGGGPASGGEAAP